MAEAPAFLDLAVSYAFRGFGVFPLAGARWSRSSLHEMGRGFANLLRGIFGTFRNPPAHTPRADEEWTITETDALDLFSMLSYVHRRLDNART